MANLIIGIFNHLKSRLVTVFFADALLYINKTCLEALSLFLQFFFFLLRFGHAFDSSLVSPAEQRRRVNVRMCFVLIIGNL